MSLCNWIVTQDYIACSPTHAQIKNFSGRVAKKTATKAKAKQYKNFVRITVEFFV